ncbi:hypothetical protein OUZ56_017666 [Daphnia magna]|uniref:Uncharacterized protein n=1 Tax=Daphnia magna TaxID=35525 RepID=A0ABR0ATJ7_9CRUS|nr:hypothetical protein OUZ56_017666 [Daphnia magna]
MGQVDPLDHDNVAGKNRRPGDRDCVRSAIDQRNTLEVAPEHGGRDGVNGRPGVRKHTDENSRVAGSRRDAKLDHVIRNDGMDRDAASRLGFRCRTAALGAHGLEVARFVATLTLFTKRRAILLSVTIG